MTAPELITSLERLGIRLQPHNGSLRCQAPKGTLTREIRQAIDSCKDEIVALLEERARSERLWSPASLCIHEIFRSWALRAPHAIALADPGRQVSYGELERLSNGLARRLRALGVATDVVVGIWMERSIEAIVGMLGVLKAGGAYLPLDPVYPQERLELMLQDAGAPVLLTKDGAPSVLSASGPSVIRVDMDQQDASDEPPEVAVATDNLAYVMYTSGSTGLPKGVEIRHRGITRLLFGVDYVALGPNQTLLHLSSTAFDASTFELWGALLHGGRCAILEGTIPSLPEITRAVAESQPTVLWLTASLYNVIIDEAPEALAPVRQLLLGGEALSVAHVKRGQEALPATTFINGYGPTENTTFTCCYPIPREFGRTATSIPIGGPIGGTHVCIVDPSMTPVAVGMQGELGVGGDGLARGYVRRPDLSAERFVPHPFSERAGDRLYRTGDLCRWRADGTIEFLGRIDRQVKVRGVRTEPGEIEAVLERHPSVARAVVVIGSDPHGNVRLHAFVLPSRAGGDGDGIDANELRRFLMRSLPSAMVPSTFAAIAELPLTPSGKIDRRRLPKAPIAGSERRLELTRPRTPEEARLAEIWCQVLGREEIGIHDDFFELGGHSLLATRIVSQVRDAFEIDLPLRVAFEATTIAALAAVIGNQDRRQAPPIVPTPRDQALPLSFAQRRLWFLNQLAPGHAFYNVPIAVRLTGPLNVAALTRAFREIVRRHETLRTSFTAIDGSAMQLVAPSVHLSVPVVDLQELSEEDRRPLAHRLAIEAAQRPFDLGRAPLLHVSILQTGESERVAVLTMHHIVSDGWSMAVLVREALVLYEAFSRGLPSPLEDLSIHYADFARWQHEWLTDEVLEGQLEYWRTALRDLPVLELSMDRPAPAVERFRGATLGAPVSGDLSRSLRALSRRENVTPFMTLLAAFQTLLFRYTGQQDVVVGSAIANRNRAEIESLIGFFVNTLVMRTDLSGDPPFRDLLGRTRDVALEAYMHQDLPFDRLVEELRPERKLMRQPLFQVMFAVQNTPLPGLQMPDGLRMEMLELDNQTAKFDLEVHVIDQLDSMHVLFMYNTDVFDESTIRRMSRRYLTLLESIVEDPEVRISDLTIESRPAFPPILPSSTPKKE
jgi:amino acid adenylation domain-containing protein